MNENSRTSPPLVVSMPELTNKIPKERQNLEKQKLVSY